MKIIVDLFNQHSGDIHELKRLSLDAFASGAHYVKIQLLNSEVIWGDDSRKHLELTRDEFFRYRDWCDVMQIPMLATAFDEETHRWVQESDLDYYKLASVSTKKHPEFCDLVLADGKPTFVSNGMFPSTKLYDGMDNVIRYFCISKYPTLLSDPDLEAFPKKFGKDEVFQGFSDHTLGLSCAYLSKARGALFLERHFSASTSLQKPGELGHLCSFTASELRDFAATVREMSLVQATIGQ